ncbi:uncharacterized protein [Desmodus rotundus]|uniref:uncharacterized protein n=1 Tax=Desmodus rotundus TaxID=9430 RepID=UPI002381305F|nr:uncharacterized protein LOC128781439 [Desmodus rotundus]
MVTLNIEGKPIDFLIDMGATFSVLKQPRGQVQKAKTKIVGATGKEESYPWTTARITNLGHGTITHSFLVIPDCPYPLLGRDLLQKLQASITFKREDSGASEGGEKVSLEVTVPLSEEYLLAALQEGKGEFTGVPEELRAMVPGVWAESNEPGLASHQPPVIVQLLSTASPVRVRQYPIPARAKRGIARHLKRLLEAGILRKCQSAWNTPLLPVQKPGTQDYRPVQDLREYVDDILIAAADEEECKKATLDLLQDLQRMGYRVSAKKAQIVTRTSLQALQQVREEVRALQRLPQPEGKSPAKPLEPGQWVWVLNHRQGNLEPRWLGPFQVLLSTPSAVRVAEKPYWIHLSHTKPARDPEEDQKTWHVLRDPEKPLQLKFSKK